MRPGPPPKPTTLKRLAGNPHQHKLNDAEPKLAAAIPQAPHHLDAEARREWHRVVHELYGAGLLSRVDRAALAAYCQAWSRWVQTSEQLASEPLILETASGYRYQNPLIGIQSAAMETMRRFMLEFGMTPSSRSRVHVEQKDNEPDELEQLLFAGKKVAVTHGD